MLGTMFLRLLPLSTGLLPILAIHTSLLVAISATSIPACIPYIEGCASISATGRYEPASFIFKPAMLTEWMLLVLYWVFSVAWIRSMSVAAGKSQKTGKWIAIVGCGGALALLLYVTFLGTQAPFYEIMRRFGIYLYFLFTVVAQILLARQTIRLSTNLQLPKSRKIGEIQLAMSLMPLVLGILNLILKSVLEDFDQGENTIEWISALLMHIYFVLTYFVWQESGFDGRFRVRSQL